MYRFQMNTAPGAKAFYDLERAAGQMNPVKRIYNIVFTCISFALACYCFYLGYQNYCELKAGGEVLKTTIAVRFLVGIFLLGYSFLHKWVNAATYAKKRKLSGMEEETLSFSEKGITSSKAPNNEVKYGEFIAFYHAKEYDYLFFNKLNALTLPLNCLEGGTVEEFEAFLEKKTGLPKNTLK